jgi:hypothetical protein
MKPSASNSSPHGEPAMAQMFRWQWMWKSRARLLGLALGSIALGSMAILYAVTRDGPYTKPLFMILFSGGWFIAVGGYQLLQGLLSPAGAFGDHEASVRPHRKKRRPKPAPEQEPLPVRQDTSDSHESL